MQVPTPTNVTVDPLAVHVDGVVLANDTAPPELDVAETVTVPSAPMMTK